jgi:nucleoside 2-deoxyribosyltransferase
MGGEAVPGRRVACYACAMTDTPRRPRIYLAGPEVFLPDPVGAGARKQALCAAHGFEGVYPFDAALDLAGLPKTEAARRICLANEALMTTCDLLIANMTPFRGVSMDVGTAFEVGYMRALGRPVLGYTNTVMDLRERSEMGRAGGVRLPFDGDAPDVEVEDFGLAENLMIEIAVMESGGSLVRSTVPAGSEMTDLAGFQDCLVQAKALMGGVNVGLHQQPSER